MPGASGPGPDRALGGAADTKVGTPSTQPTVIPGGHHPMFARTQDRTLRPTDLVLRLAIVGLALATGYIHSTLGGLLFTLNALGYLVAAVAMIVPLALAVRFRWVVRLGLIGYAATTIVGWAIQGPFFQTAYIAKGIEVALIAALAVDVVRVYGSPMGLVRAAIGSVVPVLPLPARIRALAA